MEYAPTLEMPPDTEVISIKLASTAEPKELGVSYAADKVFQQDDDPSTSYFVTIAKIPVESSGGNIHTPQNPIGIYETIGGGIQRLANLEAVLPGALAVEPANTGHAEKDRAIDLGQYLLYAISIVQASSIEIASIESGVLPTRGSFNSVIILTVPGKITPDMLGKKQLTFPEQPAVHIIDPKSRTYTEGTLDDTPFSAADAAIDVHEEGVKFPDRAVSVVYDTKTNTTFIGISRGVEFAQEDVVKTYDDRIQHPNNPEYDRRVADNMKERLERDGIIINGQYKIITPEGKEKWVPFDVQNPQVYLDPSFSRTWQIAEMELELFDRIKAKRKAA